MPEPQGLKDLLAHAHFVGPVAPGSGGEATANGVANPLVEQDRQGGGGGHDPLGAETRLGEPQVQRVIAGRGERAIDGHQIADVAHLGREDDPVVRLSEALGQLGGAERAFAHRLEHHLMVFLRLGATGVLIHQPGEQRSIERSPVDADPHRLALRDRDLDHAAEVLVVLPANTNVARIDAVLIEG